MGKYVINTVAKIKFTLGTTYCVTSGSSRIKFVGFRRRVDERSVLLERGAMLLCIWFWSVALKCGSLIFKG